MIKPIPPIVNKNSRRKRLHTPFGVVFASFSFKSCHFQKKLFTKSDFALVAFYIHYIFIYRHLKSKVSRHRGDPDTGRRSSHGFFPKEPPFLRKE